MKKVWIILAAAVIGLAGTLGNLRGLPPPADASGTGSGAAGGSSGQASSPGGQGGYFVLSVTENGPGTVDVKLKNPRTGYVHSITLILQVAIDLGLKAGDWVTESRGPNGPTLSPMAGPTGGGAAPGGGSPSGGGNQPNGSSNGPPGSPNNPLKAGVTQNGRPLDWLKNAANWVADTIPDGGNRLQQAKLFTDFMRQGAEQGLQQASKISDMMTPKTPVDFALLAAGPFGVTANMERAVATQGLATAAREIAQSPAARTAAGKLLSGELSAGGPAANEIAGPASNATGKPGGGQIPGGGPTIGEVPPAGQAGGVAPSVPPGEAGVPSNAGNPAGQPPTGNVPGKVLAGKVNGGEPGPSEVGGNPPANTGGGNSGGGGAGQVPGQPTGSQNPIPGANDQPQTATPRGPPLEGGVGIPTNVIKDGDVVFGLYRNANDSDLPSWAEKTGAKTADDFLRGDPRAFRNTDPNDPRYRGYPLWVAAFDKAAKEGVPVHFDLTGINNIRKTLFDSSAGRGVTAGELQWLRGKWNEFANNVSKPRFWLNGQETKPPWQWANPETPSYLP